VSATQSKAFLAMLPTPARMKIFTESVLTDIGDTPKDFLGSGVDVGTAIF